MRLYYIFHSAFAIEAEGVVVIIDFYWDTVDLFRGLVHDVLLRKPSKIYVLSSHFHPDHFNPEIFKWRSICPEVTYILSQDILRHHRASKDDAVFLKKGDVYDDGILQVNAFGSTDSGDSFLVTLQHITFFHAGDLNNWHWKDVSSPQEVKQAEGNYMAELKFIASHISKVDVAMFPVDARMGSEYAKGAKQFLEKIKCSIFVPMHFGYEYKKGNVLSVENKNSVETLFISINRKGQCIDITKLLNNK